MAAPITEERRNQLAQILMWEGSLRVNEMANKFSVSTETIRKDISYLEEIGIAKKSHGGALIINDGIFSHFSTRSVRNVDAKNRIAAKALEYIPENGVIFIDIGSTAMTIAKQLISHSNLSIITNSLVVANILSNSSNPVYVLGGRLNGANMSLLGLWAIDALNSINPDVAFLGTSGFQDFSGPTTGSFDESEARKKVVQISKKSIVIADSSKFHEKTGLVSYSSWDDIDMLITDNGAPKESLESLKENLQIVAVDL
jgi:Transcriptional regulators of sugar metabolism